jgi:putative alpha-1,2-mannosidase
MLHLHITFLVLAISCTWKPAEATAAANTSGFDPLKYVDQLIGTNNGGNVFAGATLPYGMAKAVADVSGQNTGGFSTDGTNITGFSHMHDSGTGGNPSLGNFPLFPQYCPEDDLDNCRYPKLERAVDYVSSSVVATPGYFALSLTNGIHAEMTVTEHTALYHFNFPSATSSNGSALSPQIVLDLTDMSDTRQNATINVDSDSGRIKATGTFLPSFGAGSYVTHVCVDFVGSPIHDSGIFVNERAGTEPKEIFVTRGFNLFYLQAGGFVRFDRPKDGTITARVGMSFISADQACENAEREIPSPETAFDAVKASAEKSWRHKLSPISVEAGGVSEDMQKAFWSGIYRTMISPQDYTGENPAWESSEPYYESYYWYVSFKLIRISGRLKWVQVRTIQVYHCLLVLLCTWLNGGIWTLMHDFSDLWFSLLRSAFD